MSAPRRPGCACIRLDAHDCYRARYPRSFDELDTIGEYGLRCECSCHDENEDDLLEQIEERTP